MFTRVKGTQDILDMTLYNYVLDHAHDHFATYHFTEIATPILEKTALYKRSLGQFTDVVTKEMFTIDPEKSKESICLRPEATASIVRAFVENGVDTIPWKVYTHGSMFRYERPQKGRYREFHQINVEVIGSAAVAQDVQLLTMLDRFFHEKLQINDYALLINYLGCADDRAKYTKELQSFLKTVAANLCDTCKIRADKNPLRVFDCKNEPCQQQYDNAPFPSDTLCKPCAHDWKTLQETLELMSVSFSHRPMLVRGLDYYNKTVFEFVSNRLGAQNAFCGGGRYDKLVGIISGKKDQPSIGAAIGLERLLLVLDSVKDMLPIPQPKALHVIMPQTEEQQALALMLADTLQANNLATEVLLEKASIKSMMRKANKLGAAYCLILGEQEQQDKTVTVKNMINGAQETIAQIDLLKNLK